MTNGHAAQLPTDDDSFTYTLFAVINHTGTLDQGHYTNFVRMASQVCHMAVFWVFSMVEFEHGSWLQNCTVTSLRFSSLLPLIPA